MARLDRIPDARQVAQTAAAIGREFDFKLLRDVSSTEETDLSSALGQLVEAEIIFCRGIPPEASYSFKHALVRDAAYESLLREKRRSLHGQIADALIDDPTGFGRTEAVLAYHQALAERHEDAIRTWIAAADRAGGQSAYQEALGLVDTAVDHLPDIQDKELRSELEISVELARADVRQILDGPTETAIAAYTRVRELARRAGNHRQEFIGAWGLWFNDQQRNDLPSAAKRASELIPLAELADDSNCVLQANHANWTTAFYSGDLISTKKFAQQGYETLRSNVSLSCTSAIWEPRCWVLRPLSSSEIQLPLGLSRYRRQLFRGGVELARRLEHPGSLVVALVIQVIIQQMMGDIDAVENSSKEFGALADRHGMARFAPVSRIMLGWVDACRNEGQRAIDEMKSGIESLESTGGLMRLTYYKGLLANALWRIGNVEAALTTADDGIEFVKSTGEGWYLPELHRLKGAMLLKTLENDEGVRQLKVALDLARKRSARWFELRTTTSLAGHLADRGEGQEAIELLEPIYNWFTEGAETPDLRHANALLQKLSGTTN